MLDIIKALVAIILAAIAIVGVILFAPVSPVLIAVTAVKDLVFKLTGAPSESK
jgi:hypothetical protein